jgi:Tfp pilus assembly protein PilX
MIELKKTKPKTSERGIALVIALLTLLLISAALVGMIIASNTETSISTNFRDEQVAFFAARSGLEEVRDRFRSGAPNNITASLPAALPGTSNGVLYITNPIGNEVVAPWNTAGTNYPDDEICKEATCVGGVPAGNPWYASASASASYAAAPKLTWKWVRIIAKVNKPSALSKLTPVDGSMIGNRVCWNGSNEVVTALGNCGANTPVYVITALAVTPSGSRRMIQYEETLNINIPIIATLYTKLATSTGDALNVTGMTDPVCAAPPVYGAVSGTSNVTTPGPGNVTGSPAATANNYGWSLGDLSGLINPLLSNSTGIATVPGMTHDSSNPPNYTLTNGNLGTLPSVTRDGSQAITAITAPGAPITYATPIVGNLTLGGGSGGVNGQGVLIVQGNLTIDVGAGFNYYGLIIVTGNITMISSSNSSVMPNINGALIGGGTFSAPISNFGGSISVHQNACAVRSSLGGQFYKTVSDRELIY